MSRFVLLFHDWPTGPRGSHCDLMLEADGVLRTWAVAELPREWQTVAKRDSTNSPVSIAQWNSVRAEQLGDHRLTYLDYEGPVSGDRGFVRRLDRGELEIVREGADECEALLRGGVLREARIELKRCDDGWQLSLL